MAIYCNDVVPGFQQDVCANEQGRITALAFIRTDNATLSGYTTSSEWLNGVANGTIHIIKNVRGEKPKSSVISIDGFGLQKTFNIGRDFTLTVEGPDIINNEDWFNAMNPNNSFKIAYYTSGGKIWIAGEAIVAIDADSVVTNALDSIIIYNLTATWSSQVIPVAYTAPAGVFTL